MYVGNLMFIKLVHLIRSSIQSISSLCPKVLKAISPICQVLTIFLLANISNLVLRVLSLKIILEGSGLLPSIGAFHFLLPFFTAFAFPLLLELGPSPPHGCFHGSCKKKKIIFPFFAFFLF